jgi:putative ABC transport system permease protein
MLSGYFRLMRRFFIRNRLYSITNLVGLSIGIGCFILISLYVRNELSYDDYNKNAGRILLLQQFESNPSAGGRLAADLKHYFEGIGQTVRLKNTSPLITYRENAGFESNFYFADSTVFSIFTFPLVQGNAYTALKENYGVVISEKMAEKYFPHQNPLGREIVYNKKYTLHVTGVMKNLPSNSHLPIDFLANYANANELMGWDVTNNYWAGSTLTYLLLNPHVRAADIEARFPAYLKTLNDPNAAFVWKLHLIPLRDVYLSSPFASTKPITYVYIFSIVSLFILALACFNYINLATAQVPARAKEVGIRKVLGSSTLKLRLQFIFETAFFVTGSVVAALFILHVGMDRLNSLTGKGLSLNPVFSIRGVALLVAGIALISILAGSYPAFILSSYRAAIVLKGDAVHGKSRAWLRKILVVAQFSVSMVMIIATIIVIGQLQFIRNRDLGYQRSQILTLDLRDAPDNGKAVFKQQVINLSAVSSATIAYGLPGSNMVQGQKLLSECVPRGAKDASIDRLTIDEDYLKTFDIKLVEGRSFDKSRIADKKVFLINEAAKRYFGWKDIKGRETGYYTFVDKPDGSYSEIPQRGAVIGVIGDYNHTDLKKSIQPLIISLDEGWESEMAIRLNPGNFASAIDQIRELWRKDFPGDPFSYQFMDESFNRTYQAETRTGELAGLFSMLAILISCLGLFGLVAYAAARRSKEIAIRKVLGASIGLIVRLLSTEFTALIGISILLSFPLAWFLMKKWLQDFAYRMDIHWWVFAMTAGIVVVIAALTVGVQTVRAAIANPVKVLKAE